MFAIPAHEHVYWDIGQLITNKQTKRLSQEPWIELTWIWLDNWAKLFSIKMMPTKMIAAAVVAPRMKLIVLLLYICIRTYLRIP